MTIPDYHPSYMALRYPIFFLCGEQSWHNLIPLAGHDLPADHPLHARRRNRATGTLRRHAVPAFDDEPEEGELGWDPEYQDDGSDQPRRGRGGSTRITRRQFYVKWIQVSTPFIYLISAKEQSSLTPSGSSTYRPDRADFSVNYYHNNPAPSGKPRRPGEFVDEITEFHLAWWIGSAEAVWKMFSFGMGTMKLSVERLQIHPPNQ